MTALIHSNPLLVLDERSRALCSKKHQEQLHSLAQISLFRSILNLLSNLVPHRLTFVFSIWCLHAKASSVSSSIGFSPDHHGGKLSLCCVGCVQKDSTLSKLAAMEGAVPKQLQPAFKKVMQRLQQVRPSCPVHATAHHCASLPVFHMLPAHVQLDNGHAA